MVKIIMVIISIASGQQLDMLISKEAMSKNICEAYIEDNIKSLTDVVSQHAGEPVKLEMKCAPLDRDA